MVSEAVVSESETLGSVVNEFGENEFGDSELVGNPVAGSAVVVKLLMLEGRVEVIGGFRERLAQSTPAAGIKVRSSTTWVAGCWAI